MPFKRQNTTSTTSSRKKKTRSPSPIGRKQPSFKKEAKASSSGPKLKQDTYPTYNLRWEALQAFLQHRFPEYDFEERVVNGDKYEFDIPELLTAEEKAEIHKLKDAEEVTYLESTPERYLAGEE